MRKGSKSPFPFKVGDVVKIEYGVINYGGIKDPNPYEVSYIYMTRGRVSLISIPDDRFSRLVPLDFVKPYNIIKECKNIIKELLQY